MTTKDPDRLDACLAVLADVKDKAEHDWQGLWSLGQRVLESPIARPDAKAKARRAVEVVEALAKRHAAALAGVAPGAAADGKPWMAHLPVFLRQFDGVPGCVEVAAAWRDALEEHRERGVAHLKRHYAKREKDVAAAFEAGVAAVEEGFLWCEVQDRAFRASLAAWEKDAKKHKLAKKALKAYAVVEGLERAWKEGWEAYAAVQKTAGDV
jgi:hypothetical protein